MAPPNCTPADKRAILRVLELLMNRCSPRNFVSFAYYASFLVWFLNTPALTTDDSIYQATLLVQNRPALVDMLTAFVSATSWEDITRVVDELRASLEPPPIAQAPAQPPPSPSFSQAIDELFGLQPELVDPPHVHDLPATVSKHAAAHGRVHVTSGLSHSCDAFLPPAQATAFREWVDRPMEQPIVSSFKNATNASTADPDLVSTDTSPFKPPNKRQACVCTLEMDDHEAEVARHAELQKQRAIGLNGMLW